MKKIWIEKTIVSFDELPPDRQREEIEKVYHDPNRVHVFYEGAADVLREQFKTLEINTSGTQSPFPLVLFDSSRLSWKSNSQGWWDYDACGFDDFLSPKPFCLETKSYILFLISVETDKIYAGSSRDNVSYDFNWELFGKKSRKRCTSYAHGSLSRIEQTYAGYCLTLPPGALAAARNFERQYRNQHAALLEKIEALIKTALDYAPDDEEIRNFLSADTGEYTLSESVREA
jgi:hypothetical protein